MKGKKGADLAIVFGPEGKKSSGSDDDSEEMGPGFEELAAETFPDVDPSQLKALIHACMEEGY